MCLIIFFQQGQRDPSSAVDTSQGDRSLFFFLSLFKVVSTYASVINDNYPFYLHNRWYLFSYLHLSNSTWRSRLSFPKQRTIVCLCTCHHHLQPIYIWHKLLPSPSEQAVVPFFLHKHKYSLPSYYPHTWEKAYMFLRCPGSYCLLKFTASFCFICNLLTVCCWPQMLCTKHRRPSHNHWLVAELLYFMIVINFLPRISKLSLATRLCSISVILRIKRFLF